MCLIPQMCAGAQSSRRLLHNAAQNELVQGPLSANWSRLATLRHRAVLGTRASQGGFMRQPLAGQIAWDARHAEGRQL